jgi:hypothetical protein
VQRLLIVAVLLGCSSGVYVAQDHSSSTLDLCGVAANVGTYSGHEVLITAFFAVSAESVVLYDPKCQNGKPLIWVEFKPKVGGQMKALRRILEKKHSALVTVEGALHGGEPVKVDPKLPDWLKDRLKGSSLTYGHLGSFDIMIEVGRVVHAKDAGDSWEPK